MKIPPIPYFGTKAGSSSTAPMASTIKEIPTIPLRSRGVSSKLLALVDSCASCRVRSPNFRRINEIEEQRQRYQAQAPDLD